MTSSNALLFPGRAFDTTKFHGHWPSNGKLHRGAEFTPPVLPDSEKSGLFRVKL